MDLKDTYNKIAEDWHKDHQLDDWWVEGTDKFISLLKPGAHVLDVGCASGVKSRYLINAGLNVTGIDFAENFIDIARREVPEAKFLVMDMCDVTNLNQEFDAIFAQASLLHIPRMEILTVLRGLTTKLKPGGYLYVAVKGKQNNGPDEETRKEESYGYTYERFFSYFSMEELKSYLQNAGLEIVYEMAQISGRHTQWIQVVSLKY